MNLPFELHTDWSAVGLGAVPIQIDSNGKEFVIAYALRSNNRTERNYSSYYGNVLLEFGLSCTSGFTFTGVRLF
jgi:hypothetical protein